MRYIATMEFYVVADSDAEAIRRAVNIAKELDERKSNLAEIIGLEEYPYGSLTSREIDITTYTTEEKK
jgi:hypothetical protein